MLVVIGIIAILIGASIGGYSSMTKSAERAKAQELVSNVATALTAMFQEEGVWPKRLINGKDGGEGGGQEQAAVHGASSPGAKSAAPNSGTSSVGRQTSSTSLTSAASASPNRFSAAKRSTGRV